MRPVHKVFSSQERRARQTVRPRPAALGPGNHRRQRRAAHSGARRREQDESQARCVRAACEPGEESTPPEGPETAEPADAANDSEPGFDTDRFEDEESFLTFVLDGGALKPRDPEDDLAVKQRLYNLGFGDRAPEEWSQAEFDNALLQYRHRRGLDNADDGAVRVMRARRSARQLKKKNGQPFRWHEIVAATGTERRDLIFEYALEVLAGNSASANPALGLENTPLGIIDPDFSRPGDVPEASNPLRLKDVQPQSVQFNRLARFARATGEEYILVENPGLPDYRLTALLQISKQR